MLKRGENGCLSWKDTEKDFTLDSVKYNVLSSENFEYSCYSSPSVPVEGFKFRRKLLPGSVPTRDTVLPTGPTVLSKGRKRQVCKVIVCLYFARKRSPLFFKIYDGPWWARNALLIPKINQYISIYQVVEILFLYDHEDTSCKYEAIVLTK